MHHSPLAKEFYSARNPIDVERDTLFDNSNLYVRCGMKVVAS